MFLVCEVPSNRIATLRAIIAGISGAKELACCASLADTMNAIEDAEVAACIAARVMAKAALAALSDADADPDDVPTVLDFGRGTASK